MGILQTLILALSRLDPENVYWKQAQNECIGIQNINSKKLNDHVGWQRKLYLIQNVIYGVDKQATACQIAKLRFFISLMIEQEPVPAQPNQGIQPLPNLEHNLIVADTLLKDRLSSNQILIQDMNTWDKWQKQIVETRQKYFLTHDQEKKRELINKDKTLRNGLLKAVKNQRNEQISTLEKRLEQDLDDIPDPNDRELLFAKRKTDIEKEIQRFDTLVSFAENFASWNPYDQNNCALWFSAEYMFGINDGFDVVIGNPPYIQLQKNGGELSKIYKGSKYESFCGTGDIYQLFYERGCELLNKRTGCLSFITSNSWLHAKSGKNLRRYISKNYKPLCLIDLGSDVFDSATVDVAVLLVEKNISGLAYGLDNNQCEAIDIEDKSILENPKSKEDWGILSYGEDAPWIILSCSAEKDILEKMHSVGTPLKEHDDISIYRGVLTGFNQAFIINTADRNRLIKEHPSSEEILKPILGGRDIAPYHANWAGLWLIATFPSCNININHYPAIKQHLESYGKSRLAQDGLPNGQSRKKTTHAWFELQDTCAYHEEFSKTKLLWNQMSASGKFALCKPNIMCNQKCFMITGMYLFYLCAMLNSKLITWFVKKYAVTTTWGLIQWDKYIVEDIPIIHPQQTDIDKFKLKKIEEIVNSILSNLNHDPLYDVDKHQREIDDHIFKLYGLTSDEQEFICEYSANPPFPRIIGS